MERRNGILNTILILIMMLGTLPVIASSAIGSPDEIPTRGLLGYEEELQVTFPKPVFYNDHDPHYPSNDIDANTWEDIAIIVVLQDQNRVIKNENAGSGSSTAQCADVYQTVFVPLDGVEVQTGAMETVIVEDFTATWCTYCTGVIGAMNRMDLDPAWFPNKYIGVEWHSGQGTYGTGEPYIAALERRDSYDIEGGIPRYIIDGMDPWVGGSSSANETSIDNRIRGIIDQRRDDSMIKITATGDHDSTSAWVDITYEVIDDSFSNTEVEASVFLVQDAYPRRHGTNANARLGYIGQDIKTVKIFELDMPDIILNSPAISQAMGDDDVAEGDLEIIWAASDDEDDPNDLLIDLYYTQGYDENWYVIAEDQPNTGSYYWDTMDPRIPDGTGYKIRVVAEDSDEMRSESILNFDFEINNPDPPSIVLTSHKTEGEVNSGKVWVTWNSNDDEDMKSALIIDLLISDDEGTTFEDLASTLLNSGNYELDTRTLEDGDSYMIKARVTDTTYLESEIQSAVFTIFNNDPPEGVFTNPADDDHLMGTVEVTWTSLDDEDAPEELKVDLFYRYEDEGWEPLLEGEDNTRSYSLDTAAFVEGDGAYQLKLILTDPLKEVSEVAFVEFTVYNPRSPIITGPKGPIDPVELTAEFIWFAEDPNPDETFDLQYWISISSDGMDWTQVDGDRPNMGSYELDISDLEDGNYQVKLIVADKTAYNLTAEHIFHIQVDNPDAPSIAFVTAPQFGQNLTGDITISWTAQDEDGDSLAYTVYYRIEGSTAWIPIPGAMSIAGSSYIWNTSALTTGNYQLMVTARDDSNQHLEDTIETQTFKIYIPPEDSGDDDTGGDPQIIGSDSGSDDTTLLIVSAIVLLVLFLIVILLVIVVVIRRRPQPVQQMPPPMPPGMPSHVAGGQLPPGPTPSTGAPGGVNTFPPAPVPAPQMLQPAIEGGQYQPPIQPPYNA